MNKYEIVKRIEDFAPLNTQEEWDASGWIVDLAESEVNKVMFALTVTEDVLEQATKNNCDMIISHHPMFFVPWKFKNINIYCAHTNLDKAKGGTTDTLIRNLHFEGRALNDFVRIVNLDREMSIEFLKLKLLPISPRLRIVNNKKIKTIKSIGFCAGSGSEFISSTPCDAFVTGDLKYHTAVESNKVIYDIGHFESEVLSKGLLKEISGVGEKGIFANEESPFS
ncbi:Nif3-like dinuclear metal center hexameric protein [bacterium]|nr:Nif3-like dinuclear metal center hexameric protein [bacterium]